MILNPNGPNDITRKLVDKLLTTHPRGNIDLALTCVGRLVQADGHKALAKLMSLSEVEMLRILQEVVNDLQAFKQTLGGETPLRMVQSLMAA